MTSASYLPFLIQIILAAAIGAVVIGASHFFGQRTKKNAVKDTPYECGLKSEGVLNTRFTARFFVTALLFLIFDLEVVFLLPVAFIYREFLANNLPVFWPLMTFLSIVLIGLFYEVKKGALDWER
jgi:NADH-quinone oxidoreductase subunit A